VEYKRPWGAFIFHILIKSQLKFQFWGSYTLIVAPMGVKFGTEEGGDLHVAPVGQKPQNRPL